jgi:hypothetical protein
MAQKISSHFFNSLYLFDRAKELYDNYDGNGPTALYAAWPIFNRAKIAVKQNGSWVRFGNFDGVINGIYKKEDSKFNNCGPSEFAKNYFVIPEDRIHEYRGLFHDMIHDLSFTHEASFELSGSSSGPIKRSTYCGNPSSSSSSNNPNKYEIKITPTEHGCTEFTSFEVLVRNKGNESYTSIGSFDLKTKKVKKGESFISPSTPARILVPQNFVNKNSLHVKIKSKNQYFHRAGQVDILKNGSSILNFPLESTVQCVDVDCSTKPDSKGCVGDCKCPPGYIPKKCPPSSSSSKHPGSLRSSSRYGCRGKKSSLGSQDCVKDGECSLMFFTESESNQHFAGYICPDWYLGDELVTKNYECDREHSKKIDIKVEYNKNHGIYDNSMYGQKVSGSTGVFYIKTVISPSSSSSIDIKLKNWRAAGSAKSGGKESEIVKNKAFNLGQLNQLISNSSGNSLKTLEPDPVLGYTSGRFGGKVDLTIPYKRNSFLNHSINLNSQESRFNYNSNLNSTVKNVGYLSSSVSSTPKEKESVKYVFSAIFRDVVFNESLKQYWFLIDVDCNLNPGLVDELTWKAGDYESGLPDDPSNSKCPGVYYEKSKISYNNTLYDGGIIISTSQAGELEKIDYQNKKVGSIKDSKKASQNGGLKKVNIPIKIEGDVNSTFNIECFSFSKGTSELSSSSSSSPCECDIFKKNPSKKPSLKWNALKKIEIRLHSFKNSDFVDSKSFS